MFVSFLLQEGASLSAVNCDGDVPLDIALDESTESLLQDYTLRQGEGHFSQLCPPPPKKKEKHDVSAFVSACSGICCTLSQQPFLEDIKSY